MKFEMTVRDAHLSLVVKHSGDHQKGIAAGAYVGHLSFEDRSTYIWGYGGVKNTETLYFYGIKHALNEAMSHLPGLDFNIQVFVPSVGFQHTLKVLLPIWRKNGGLNAHGTKPDAFDVINECDLLMQLGRLTIDEITKKKGNLQYIDEEASRISKIAFAASAYKTLGIVKQGTELQNAA